MINNYRKKINKIDKKMITLLEKRIKLVQNISNEKTKNNLNIFDNKRELELIENIDNKIKNKNNLNYINLFYNNLFDISKKIQTKPMFYLMGRGLSHSYSPLLHKIIASHYNLDYTYETFELDKDKDAKEVLKDQLLNHKALCFNITMPLKEEIIDMFDYVSNITSKISVCNTCFKYNNLLIGTNTDYYGARYTIMNNINEFKNKDIYIFGTGATAKTVGLVLKDLNLKAVYVSRNPKNKKMMFKCISYSDLKNKKLSVVINTTPVGMFPDNQGLIISESKAKEIDFVFDVIYNPKKTRLLKLAKKGVNGLDMLIVQAIITAKFIYPNIKFNDSDIKIIKEKLIAAIK